MNMFEAGIIAGAPAGAVLGGAAAKSYGAIGIAGGAIVGAVSGAAVGWLYALLIIGLLSVIGVLVRAALKRPVAPPTEADMNGMTPNAVRGIFIGVLLSLITWFVAGWLPALGVFLGTGVLTAFTAVARCERR